MISGSTTCPTCNLAYHSLVPAVDGLACPRCAPQPAPALPPPAETRAHYYDLGDLEQFGVVVRGPLAWHVQTWFDAWRELDAGRAPTTRCPNCSGPSPWDPTYEDLVRSIEQVLERSRKLIRGPWVGE